MEPAFSGPTLDSYTVELQALEDYRNFSATTIQRYYRGWACRIRQQRQKDAQAQQQQAHAAAAQLQQRQYKAARTIQDAWRSFNNKRIYRYYRDLIRFREAGDPRQMLRSINAREAALIDAAAGLHVRFRLGGSSFPPFIFYKIFTHRPVTDIGAFGPRNYAAENEAALHSPAALHNKQEVASCSNCTNMQDRQPHKNTFEDFELPAKLREYIKPDGTVGCRSTKGWYRRDDRNGWRPVIARLLLDQEQQAALPPVGAGMRCQCTAMKRRRCKRQRLHVLGMSACGAAIGFVQSAQEKQFEQQQQQQQRCQGSEHSCSETGSCSCRDVTGQSCAASSRGAAYYHYNPIVRREERARSLKQRRRQWLLKMYRAGMQDPTSTTTADPDNVQGFNISSSGNQSLRQDGSSVGVAAERVSGSSTCKAASGRRSLDEEEKILRRLELELLGTNSGTANAADGSCGKGANGKGNRTAAGVMGSNDNQDNVDWDVDVLVEQGFDAGILAWSQQLDFDSYQQHWNSTAVTLGSSALVPGSEKLLLQQIQQEMMA